jgi:uncharacterized protein (DUF2147 family)
MTNVHLKLLTFAAVALASTVLTGAQAQPTVTASTEPSAAGLWEQVDEDTHQPGGWFRISEKENGVYEGVLVKTFPKPGEDPATFKCTKCEGAEKDAPVIGLALIKGMKRSGLTYKDGTIMDPRNGSVWSANMTVSPDGQKLELRGYLKTLGPWAGKSQFWNRLPDNAMDPAGAQPKQPPRGAASNAKGAAPTTSGSGQAKPSTPPRPAPTAGTMPPPPR